MADEVFTNTDLSQLPVYSSTLTGDVYLNPSSKRQQEMRSAWDTALQLSTAGAVRWFLSQYRATSYEAAARLWLSKNSNRRWAYRTQVSPLMMERLWETAPSDGRPVLAISGGFQFIKNVTVRGGVIGSFDEGMDVGDLLAHSQLAMVAIQNLSVKDGPNFEADEKRKLGFNDIAYIIGAERNSSGTWLRIHDRGSDNLYFRLPDRVKVEKKEMGAKAKEIFVGASPDSTSIGARCRWTTISEALFFKSDLVEAVLRCRWTTISEALFLRFSITLRSASCRWTMISEALFCRRRRMRGRGVAAGPRSLKRYSLVDRRLLVLVVAAGPRSLKRYSP